MNGESSPQEVLAAIRETLLYLRQAGCKGFDCSPKGIQLLADLGKTVAPAAPVGDTLDAIRDDLGECTRCPLCHARTRIVFGEGAPQADLVFVGEGPGQDEDRCGRPFVGAAGQLLTKIIAAMNLSREDVYIANIVKCRPPNNRAPTAEEIGSCLPFLRRQLAVIRPRVICTLGNVAARALLDTDRPISRIRGRFHEFMGIAVMPTFHPAYLLRQPDKKRDVWNDIQQVMKRLGHL